MWYSQLVAVSLVLTLSGTYATFKTSSLSELVYMGTNQLWYGLNAMSEHCQEQKVARGILPPPVRCSQVRVRAESRQPTSGAFRVSDAPNNDVMRSASTMARR